MRKKKFTIKDSCSRYLIICMWVIGFGVLTMARYGWLQLVRGQELAKRS